MEAGRGDNGSSGSHQVKHTQGAGAERRDKTELSEFLLWNWSKQQKYGLKPMTRQSSLTSRLPDHSNLQHATKGLSSCISGEMQHNNYWKAVSRAWGWSYYLDTCMASIARLPIICFCVYLICSRLHAVMIVMLSQLLMETADPTTPSTSTHREHFSTCTDLHKHFND